MNNLTVTEFKDLRVLTTQQVAESYETDSDMINRNFNNNKERYTEGKHFILLQGDELKEAKTNGNIYGLSAKVNKFYLWTEKGCLLHAKSLGTDKAWEVYEELVDTYFKVQKPLSAIEQLQLTQRAIIEVKADVDSVNDDLQAFKKDMPLLGIEESKITAAVRKKGVNCLGGKDSEAYQDRSLRGQVYSDIYGQLKREFGVDTYKAIKRSQCEHAVGIINCYELPMVLEEEIANTNAQMYME